MTYWIVALILVLLAIIVGTQYQIGELSNHNREIKCSTIVGPDGIVRKADEYEYYVCLSR